jgi:hypothetical protein
MEQPMGKKDDILQLLPQEQLSSQQMTFGEDVDRPLYQLCENRLIAVN